MATQVKQADKQETRKTTRLEVLIDESGSMEPRARGVVDGYNEFMDAMRSEEGELLVSLTMFDSRPGPWVRRRFEDVPIEDIKPLRYMSDYQPHGGTPLNDALFETLEALGSRVREDENAIVVVMTDGQENQSVHHTADDVKAIISARENDGWAFVYLGANHDVWAQSGGLGYSHHTAKQFSGSSAGTQSSMRAGAVMTNAYRAGGQSAYNLAASATPDSIPDDFDPTNVVAEQKGSDEVAKAVEQARKAAQ
jgi:uncharacterized protein YegL